MSKFSLVVPPPNLGRHFLGCHNWKRDDCGFFKWIDLKDDEVSSVRGSGSRGTEKLLICLKRNYRVKGENQ